MGTKFKEPTKAEFIPSQAIFCIAFSVPISIYFMAQIKEMIGLFPIPNGLVLTFTVNSPTFTSISRSFTSISHSFIYVFHTFFGVSCSLLSVYFCLLVIYLLPSGHDVIIKEVLIKRKRQLGRSNFSIASFF